MQNFEDAKLLVKYATERIILIEQEYKKSLHKRLISPELLIEIKNLMENLRSALDFLANGLYERYGNKKKGKRIYFPYATLAQTKDDFEEANRIKICIPGLYENRPDIVEKINSYQHFASSNNRWLPIFMELNNKNKHQQLTPQTRKETKWLRLSSGGCSIYLGPQATMKIGKGAKIILGDMTIPGEQKADVSNPPITIGNGDKEVIVWVSFNFSTNNEPVLPLLSQALRGIESIVNELSAM